MQTLKCRAHTHRLLCGLTPQATVHPHLSPQGRWGAVPGPRGLELFKLGSPGPSDPALASLIVETTIEAPARFLHPPVSRPTPAHPCVAPVVRPALLSGSVTSHLFNGSRPGSVVLTMLTIIKPVEHRQMPDLVLPAAPSPPHPAPHSLLRRCAPW